MVGGLPQGFPGSSPLISLRVWFMALWVVVLLPNPSQTPPTSRRGPTVSPKPPPGAGTGYVRFDELIRFSPLVLLLVVSPPLPVGPVVDSVADQLRALELLLPCACPF